MFKNKDEIIVEKLLKIEQLIAELQEDIPELQAKLLACKAAKKPELHEHKMKRLKFEATAKHLPLGLDDLEIMTLIVAGLHSIEASFIEYLEDWAERICPGWLGESQRYYGVD